MKQVTFTPHISHLAMKMLISIIIALTTLHSSAQVDRSQNESSSTPKNLVGYRLFPTQNVWTFIKLNTRNGQMWQVQFGMKVGNRFVTNLSVDPLVSKEDEVNDRFTIYATQNIYNFILLDQITGKTWQVQWSNEAINRGITPIE